MNAIAKTKKVKRISRISAINERVYSDLISQDETDTNSSLPNKEENIIFFFEDIDNEEFT